MNKLPILTFKPLLKEIVWGGRRFEPLFDRTLPTENPYGESWELVDLPEDQTPVLDGPLAGTTLGELRANFNDRLLGGASLLDGRFPLLFKFIDANKTLSVQVHPDIEACKQLGNGARPKTEAWYIIDANPGSLLYVGLKEGVDRQIFAAAIEDGTVANLLHEMPVKPGDFVYLPSGTVHAIGEGIVLAEVQQSSDTTYRVFDWNRMGLDGKPRQLHIEEALESIHYTQVGPPKLVPPPSGRPGVACDYFVEEALYFHDRETVSLDGHGPLVLMGLKGDGKVEISAQGDEAFLRCGRTVFVPADRANQVQLSSFGALEVLAVRIPV